MVLNWKIFEQFNTNKDYAKLYNKLWEETDKYAENNLNGEEAHYFYRTTD